MIAQARPLLMGKSKARQWRQAYQDFRGGNVMKQICYLFWLAGMATLVAYGWSDTLMNQVSDVVQFMGQLVAFVIA
ncbi:MAG: hypothetical protein AB7D27_01760 [Desulfomicrobium sp.]